MREALTALAASELVPIEIKQVRVSEKERLFCLSIRFNLVHHRQRPNFDDPFLSHSPEIPLLLFKEELPLKLHCLSTHVQSSYHGFLTFQCYNVSNDMALKLNDNKEEQCVFIQNSKSLGLRRELRDGTMFHMQEVFTRNIKMRINMDKPFKQITLHVCSSSSSSSSSSRKGIDSRKCLRDCFSCSELCHQQRSTLMTDGNVIFADVTSRLYHLSSNFMTLSTKLTQLICGHPPSFYDCSKISRQGVCYRKPCRLIHHQHEHKEFYTIKSYIHPALTTNSPDKSSSFSPAIPRESSLQPLNDPFLFCITRTKPHAVKICTESLLHVQKHFNSSLFWKEISQHRQRYPPDSASLETKVVLLPEIAVLQRMRNFTFLVFTEFVTFLFAIIGLIVLLMTSPKSWKRLKWRL